MATVTRTSRQSRLAAYAALVRVPNLFTAPPDVVVGAALASVAVGGVDPFAVAALAVASVLLYAGGTTLNDYADADEDARERPHRPIPSGAVSATAARRLAVACLLAGVVVATVAAGVVAGAVATLLAGVVVAYDLRLKGTGVGFLTMGAARGLNVCLGLAVVGASVEPAALRSAFDPITSLVLVVPLVTTLYVASVTAMAARETTGENRGAVGVAVAGAAGAAVVAPALVLVVSGTEAALLAAVFAVGFIAWVGRPLRRAYATPRPGTVGPAVGACVLGLVVLDAALAAVAGPVWALVALAHLAPASALAGAFDVS